MDIKLQVLDLLYLVTGLLGIIIAIILIGYRGHRFNRYNYLLGLGFLCLSIAILIGFQINTGLILKLPFLYRFGNLFVLLCMPFSYLYVRSVISRKSLSFWDLLLFLPTLFYFMDMWPILQSGPILKGIFPGKSSLRFLKGSTG